MCVLDVGRGCNRQTNPQTYDTLTDPKPYYQSTRDTKPYPIPNAKPDDQVANPKPNDTKPDALPNTKALFLLGCAYSGACKRVRVHHLVQNRCLACREYHFAFANVLSVERACLQILCPT